MVDIEALLRARASVLAPTDGQRQSAAISHKHLRALLSTGNMEYRIQNDYLSGSYARHTAIRPLDDVDIVFEIDPTRWKVSPWRTLFTQLPAPSAVLETFARAIRYRYPNSSVRTQRRSVGLVMEHLHIDVVPAVVDEARADWLRIPDGNEGSWIVTAPRVHADVATNVNTASGGLFKPLVRLLKGWNAGLPTTTSFKSFAVETLAARVFSNLKLSSLFEGAYQFLDFVAWRGGHPSGLRWADSLDVSLGSWQGNVPDLAGTGSNVIAGCDAQRRAKFTEAARVTRDAFAAAARARSTDVAWSYVEPRLRAGMTRL